MNLRYDFSTLEVKLLVGLKYDLSEVEVLLV